MTAGDGHTPVTQALSIVIPVYRAGPALESTCREILDVCGDVSPTAGVRITLDELILVCDNPGLSVEALDHLARLADLDERVRVVWLSRNFGQHPATVAGIVSTNGDWVVTMDEDGQHDPVHIREMLATAGRNRTPLVYAEPTNTRPHGAMRNAASWLSGRVARSVSGVPVRFHSFRLLEGSLARSACAYAGENVFLDVSLSWTCGPPSACPVQLRQEAAPSSYNYRRLLSHFWRMIVSSGTRPLRFIAAAGVVIALTGLVVGTWLIVERIRGDITVPGVDLGGHRPAGAARRALRRGGGRGGVRGAGGAQHGRAAGVRPGRPPGGPGVARPESEPDGGGGGLDRGNWAGRLAAMRLIAGSTGVIGSGFVDVLRRRGEPFTAMQVPWGDRSGAADRVVSYWLAAEEAYPGSPITLVWAAGTGTVGASEGAMAAETETLAAVVEALAGAVRPNLHHCLLFTSSAGAIYGGHRTGVIDEATPPAPITPYGREKLAQEGIVARLSQAGVMRTVVCRFTNVYGLADGRLRRKGLVPALVESAMLRQPVRLFVSPDTRRDYLFNVDAARLALAEADAATTGAAAGPARMKIIRAGSTMTILDLVASTSRALHRRVPVVITESPESRVQPLVLRFRERSGIQATIPTTSLEAALRSMAEAPGG